MARMIACDCCGGDGGWMERVIDREGNYGWDECAHCGGSGEVREPECECDVCGARVARLHAVEAYGIETYACDACVGEEEVGDE